MRVLNRLRDLPPKQKKIILWVVMVIIALFLFLLYAQKIKKILEYNKAENIKEELQIEKLKENLQNIPEF